MKTKILLTLAAALLATATYSLYAGTGANLLTGRAPAKAATAPSPRVVTGTEPADRMNHAKCLLNGTPKNIAMPGSQATMTCCGQTVATCPAGVGCGK